MKFSDLHALPMNNCVKIHLMPAARARACSTLMSEMRKRGDHVPKNFQLDFTGPDFKGAELQFAPDMLSVRLHACGTTYMYPIHQVARVKVYHQTDLAK